MISDKVFSGAKVLTKVCIVHGVKRTHPEQRRRLLTGGQPASQTSSGPKVRIYGSEVRHFASGYIRLIDTASTAPESSETELASLLRTP